MMTRVGDGNVTSGAVGAATVQLTNSVATHAKVTLSARAQGATMAPRSSVRIIHIVFRIFGLAPQARLINGPTENNPQFLAFQGPMLCRSSLKLR
ncbi:MAG: hypothetical protein WB780_18330 [Candidatus Acidiferrales bacterium]